MEAKKVSLVVKICTCIFIVICCVLKWLGVFATATISEICIAGGTLAGIFGDVSINLMMEKWSKKNDGKDSTGDNGTGSTCSSGANNPLEVVKEESCEGS